MAQSMELRTAFKYASTIAQDTTSGWQWVQIINGDSGAENFYRKNRIGYGFQHSGGTNYNFRIKEAYLTDGATLTPAQDAPPYVFPTHADNTTQMTNEVRIYKYPTTPVNSTNLSHGPTGVVLLVDVHETIGNTTSLMAKMNYTNFGHFMQANSTQTGAIVSMYTSMQKISIGGGLTDSSGVVSDLGLAYQYQYTGEAFSSYDDDAGYVVFNGQEEAEVSQEKTYQYNVYADGAFINEWSGDVVSEPKVMNQVNTLPGEFTVDLSRNLESMVRDLEPITITGYAENVDEISDNDYLLTSTDEQLLGSINIQAAVGSGTDISVNNEVDIKEYYGGFEALLTDDGDELLTDDLERFEVENGFPYGRSMFKGYISKFTIGYTAQGELTRVKLLSHADELNNIMFETADIAIQNVANESVTPATVISQYGQMVTPYTYDSGSSSPTKLGQTFYVTGVTDVAGVSIYMIRGGGVGDDPSTFPRIQISIREGVPSANGTLVAQSSSIPANTNVPYLEYFFAFTGLSLASSTTYSMLIEVTNGGNIGHLPGVTPDDLNASVGLNKSNASGVGSFYILYSPSKNNEGTQVPTWYNYSGTDLAYKLWERGGESSFSLNSKDPANMLKQALDFGVTRGSKLRYTPESIASTNTVVSATFNTNTLNEAKDAILKYSPADWYTYVDPSDLVVYLQPRPETVKHWFELGTHIESLRLEENIEEIVNEVFFSGGLVSGATLFKRYSDSTSQAEWRRGLVKISDGRVTDVTTAEIMSMSQIARYKDPIYAGEMVVVRSAYDDIVQPGDLIGFMNFGNYIDSLRLQAVSVVTTGDRIQVTLGIMLPPVSKRVEDIRRNLNLLEMQNNPTSTT